MPTGEKRFQILNLGTRTPQKAYIKKKTKKKTWS